MNPIKKFKEENNLSYRELAERCEVTNSKLVQIANGQIDIENITLKNAIKICDGLGIENPRDLLKDE